MYSLLFNKNALEGGGWIFFLSKNSFFTYLRLVRPNQLLNFENFRILPLSNYYLGLVWSTSNSLLVSSLKIMKIFWQKILCLRTIQILFKFNCKITLISGVYIQANSQNLVRRKKISLLKKREKKSTSETTIRRGWREKDGKRRKMREKNREKRESSDCKKGFFSVRTVFRDD